MVTYLLFIVCHFCLCCLFFIVVQRPLFYLYNRSLNTDPVTRRDFKDIYRYGVRTDLKVGVYLTSVPVLLLWIFAHAPVFDVTSWLRAYDVVAVVLVTLLSVADTALYKSWQFKIEASVLAYLRSLRGTFASVSPAYILAALAALAALCSLQLLALLALLNWLNPSAHPMTGLPWWGHILVAAVALGIAVAFFCIIRGLHRRPDTPVNAFYSNNQFFNHCAVNPVYNFIYSLSVNDDFAHQFQEYDAAFCQEKFAPLFPTQGTPQLRLLNTPRPNVLVVIWESLCARFVENLGGKPGVMPNFDRLSAEGVYFTNCWAGSFRTDRGLVCILSGYLGQPTTTVIKHTRKLPNLPGLARTLRDKAGYETMAVHGGNLNIFHKSDYYWASGHDRLVQQMDFPADAPAISWGVHDGYVFDWLAEDIIRKAGSPRPWYTTFQTLSSHEPFRVPYDRIKDNMVDNSYAYVDEAFGRFIDTLKASAAWKDLLVVVTGDHGANLEYIGDKVKNPHLPLLLLGGAVRQPMRIDTLMNQTDIAATLLGQMDLPHDDFIFSRDVLADTYTYPFAFHTYNNGFIFRDATGVTHYDNATKKALEGHDEQREQTAKVILQTLYTDLSRR